MPLLKKVLSRTKRNEALEDEATLDEKHSPPPSYKAEDDTPPDITAGFAHLELSHSSLNGDIPSSDSCTAHLKLLECFYRLRQKIGSSDGLFGIHNGVLAAMNNGEDPKDGKLMALLAEKRWAIYVTKAVDRFEAWRNAVAPKTTYLTVLDAASGGRLEQMVGADAQYTELAFDRGDMPPLDVLMVWHAYMLNPRAYLEDCVREGRMSLWFTKMPWQTIVQCIDNVSFEYTPGDGAAEHFHALTSLAWSDGKDSGKRLSCFNCSKVLVVPWTTCRTEPQAAGTVLPLSQASVETLLAQGQGFADKNFVSSCPECGHIIKRDHLCAEKFLKDVHLLLDQDVNMPGTVLGLDSGIPGAVALKTTVRDYTCSTSCSFPNRLLKAGLGDALIMTQRDHGNVFSIGLVRDQMEAFFKDKKLVQVARQSLSYRPIRDERIAIRKMMSRYWDNSSPFALDLVGAVIRQGTFIEKMHCIDWLHSPALPSTVSRILLKYTRFFTILKTAQNNMAVPTLDVDLAWHTHQLSPYSYLIYSVNKTRQFIDHDDKVAETKLNDSFAWTSKQYQKMFDEPYSECTCWYCEATRESNTSVASRLFKTAPAAPVHPSSGDPRKSVHISAHSAVAPTDENGAYAAIAKKKADALETHYQKVCSRAAKKGQPQPKRNDYYYSDAYGYPVYLPMYAAYGGAMYTPGMYAVSPGCMAMGVGAVGNCCAGTCGGSVAAGGCAGNGGGGGCAGGSVGGCGGGMGGGGCGGGGGGCGGGGGGGGC